MRKMARYTATLYPWNSAEAWLALLVRCGLKSSVPVKGTE